MKTTYAFIALLGLLYVTACDDDLNPDLPAATQKGANTLGFKVDGKNWVPYYVGVSLQGDTEIKVGYNQLIHGFSISALRRTKNIDQAFDLNIESLVDTGEYFDEDHASNLYFADYNEENVLFQGDLNSSGSIVITRLDTINQIISGTFFFTVENAVGERLQITDGRFDFKYPYRK